MNDTVFDVPYLLSMGVLALVLVSMVSPDDLGFRLKVRLMIALNRLTHNCRMYKSRPESPSGRCHICVARGGWRRCPHARAIRKKMEEEVKSS